MNIKRNLRLDDFIQMEELEKMYYDEEFITPYNETYEWYKTYEYTIMAIEEDGKIIGFVNMFPIKDWVFEEIKKGVYNDKYLTIDEIIDINKCNKGNYNLFLSCVVIHHEYRKSEALNVLLREYSKYYSRVSENINFEYIITDNITKSGERFSKRLRFEKVIDSEHDSVIYMGKFDEFTRIYN